MHAARTERMQWLGEDKGTKVTKAVRKNPSVRCNPTQADVHQPEPRSLGASEPRRASESLASPRRPSRRPQRNERSRLQRRGRALRLVRRRVPRSATVMRSLLASARCSLHLPQAVQQRQ